MLPSMPLDVNTDHLSHPRVNISVVDNMLEMRLAFGPKY